MVNTVKQKLSKRQRFLEQLEAGWSISRAAKISGVSRAQLYRWRDCDPKFAKAWQESEDIGTDVLEDAARERAVEGVVTPIFDKDGKEVGRQIYYSDKLLELLLRRRRRPHVYAILENNIKETAPVNVPLTVEDLRKRYKELSLPVIEGDCDDQAEVETKPR
jgi:Homeodomain-like domain